MFLTVEMYFPNAYFTGIGSSTVMRLDSMSSADAVEGDTTSTASSSQRLRMELKRRQVKVVNL